MNADRYRLVLNRSRGMLMAVPQGDLLRGIAETAVAHGNAPGSTIGGPAAERQGVSSGGSGRALARLHPAAFAALLACSAQLVLIPTANAQIVAYKAAPATQRPTILQAGNGVPLVNIQTPSAAGVSRNAYEQFDVQTQGAILNNSRTNTQTQLGGWVQGNPWLAAGSARVILNEVISANPSQLLGYVEVAGSPAQVVIANPAGVTCNGCGFINVSRATLTTGTPLMNGGNLDGYRVEGGTIRIEGAGMDATRTGYTDLIARAVEINAGLWAQSLAVTAGANTVNAANTQATPIAPAPGPGAAPAFAIDVASLGGMYAGKIVLVGTEAGVGVRNAGHIGASAGEVRVTVDGKLTNTGEIVADGNIAIAAANLENRNLIDGRDTRIDIAGTLDNLGSARLYGDHLAIAAGTLNNHAEGGDAPTIAARSSLDLGIGTLSNRSATLTDTLIFSAGDLAIGGTLDASNQASGSATLVHNHGATIEALGNLTIAAADIRNTNADLVTQTVTESSRLVQEVQPEGWPARHDVQYFPTIFNYGIEGQTYVVDGVVKGGFEDYTFYQYTATTTATQVVSSQPGKILAGGNASFAGNLENSDSRIVAGGTLTQRGGSLANTATPGVRTTTYSGWAQFRDWDGDDEELDFGPAVGFNPAPTVTTFDLGAAAWSAGAAPGSVGTPPAAAASSLIRPAVGASYLYETDPRFASYRQWLSSDYMLQQLAADPATTQKRLGDGFYEQRLVTEQIASLTGRRFLEGFANEEAQYQALMNAGITVAREWQLRPGVALSAEQMAQLTTDMVWLVEKEVVLPDGRKEKALVPQLYARVQPGDLTPAGSLLSGEVLDVAATGPSTGSGQAITNSGTLAGRKLVALTAENVRNLGGTIKGEKIVLAASNDIEMRGGQIEAGSHLDLLAGRNIDIASATHSSENKNGGPSTGSGQAQFSRTNIERIAGLYVQNPDGQMRLAAAGDVTLLAAQIESRGTTRIDAGGNLVLGTVSAEEKNHTGGKGYRNESGSRTEVGTRIDGLGDVTLTAGGTITARAADVTSTQGNILARATDILIEAGEASSYSDISQQKKSSGFLSSKSKSQRDAFEDSTALASTFSGENVTLVADRDILIKGSNVAATHDATLIAGRNLGIEAATETHGETHEKSTTQSGVFGSGGVGFTIGSRMNGSNQQTDATTAAKSTVGGVEGNVTLLAGDTYKQVGSDVIAVKGDIDIAAKTVDIVEARETSKTVSTTRAQQSGLTVAITSPVITAIQAAQQMNEAAKDTKDGRMKALAAASTGLAGYNAANAIAEAGSVTGGVNLVISLGGSKSSSQTTQTSDTAAVSNLSAGRDIRIEASGAGKNSDITLRGTQATTARNLTFAAEDEIKLLAATNTADQKSKNQNASGSIGISIGTNTGFTVGASVGRGKADGDDLSHTNTRVEAGQTLVLESGGDTTLKGAVAKGERVVAKVGGDLLVESLQDTSTYDSKQKSLGGSITIGVGVSGAISASSSKVKSDYASVVEQSAIRAGDGGFQVDVQGDTTLTGGAITSTQQAIDENRNRFETGGELTLSDIQNQAEYEGKSVGVSIGAGKDNNGKYAPQGTSAGFGKDGDKASSMTLAAISGLAGNKDARTGDAETGIQKIFNAERVQKEIDAQVKITQTFGQLASKAVGDYADTKLKEAQVLRDQGREQEAKDIESQWGANGTLRLAAHTLIGGLTGGASGAAGAAAGTLTAPAVADALAKAGIEGSLATAITAAASTAAGAVVGGTTGAGTALNEVANNYLSHPENEKRAKARERCANGDDSACQQANELDILDRQRDAEFRAACDGELRATEGCAQATRQMFSYLGTYVGINPKEKAGDFAVQHREELQSYIDLIKTASAEVRTSTDAGIQAPNDGYNPDPYGVVDKDNNKDAYLVMKFDDKALAVGKVNDKNGNYAILSDWWARNGMLNEPDYATWLMFTHVDAAAQAKHDVANEGKDVKSLYIPVDRYTLSYAPTNGFIQDLWGTLLTKLGHESESVLGLRSQQEAIATGNRSVNWVVHSRAGVEFVQAAQGSSETDLSNNSVVFHAGANTRWTANAMMKSKGIGDVIDKDNRYRDAPNDLVPQIVGLRALTSPWNIIPSLLYAPCLSSTFCSATQSPHTLPYQWGNSVQEGK